MTRSQRLALFVAAAAVLVGGFLVARGSESDTVTTSAGAPAATAVAPDATTTATQSTTTTAAPSTTAPAPAKPAIPVVTVRGGKPVGGIKKLNVAKGDAIRFTVKSDVADEVHVHGYDIKKDVKPGKSVTFAFKAGIDGIFEVELEGAHEQIASLKVSP
ncbi:MAG: hypothetical protein JWN65_509 [Solirubrobacterales bacterium]|nr:hypothetical protein [Solirubrobacterales bacterium]